MTHWLGLVMMIAIINIIVGSVCYIYPCPGLPIKRVCLAGTVVAIIHHICFTDIIDVYILDAMVTWELSKLLTFIGICIIDVLLLLGLIAGSKSVHDKLAVSRTLISCMSWFEKYRYDSYQDQINNRAPKEVLALNHQFNHGICTCGICLELLTETQSRSILHCGHGFHRSCLRKWELARFRMKPYTTYKCPGCNKQYGHKQKWCY